MADNSSRNPWDEYEAKLALTQARRAELREKFEKKDEELRIIEEKLANGVQVMKDMAKAVDELFELVEFPINPQAAQTASPIGPDSPFYGKPLPECAVVVICEAGRALTEEEIVAGLRAGGVQIVSNKPEMNVRRSMARRPDILQMVNKKWVVIETPMDLENLPKKLSVNNFTRTHAESTRSGIEAAKARGVTWGRTPVITPEKEAMIYELRSQGLYANEIVKTIGVSRGAYFRYLREKGLTKQYGAHDSEEGSEKDLLV